MSEPAAHLGAPHARTSRSRAFSRHAVDLGAPAAPYVVNTCPTGDPSQGPTEGTTVKYVLMFTSRPDLDASVDPELAQTVYKKVYEWFAENGEKFADGGAELLGVETATSVKHGDDGPLVVDGPFNEAKEVVGGFAIID